jgi:hypothetical protein
MEMNSRLGVLLDVCMSCTAVSSNIHNDIGDSVNNIQCVYCKLMCFHILLLASVFIIYSGVGIPTGAEEFPLLQIFQA